MSKKMAALLQKPEHVVTKAIADLEAQAGYPSADVRLLAENHANLRTKITQLGLDADDTTGQELYHAVLARFGHDTDRIDAAAGSVPGEQRLTKAIEMVQHCGLPDVWALKSSSVKKMLKAQPPNKTMKLLGYRSLESMLKREDVLSVYTAATATESATWQKAVAKLANKLDSTNFETRQFDIEQLSDRYDKLNIKEPVINTKAGLAITAQSKKFQAAPVLSTALQLLKSLQAANIKTQKDITSLHPALGWWAGIDHLVTNHGDQPISLNINDAAANHANSNNYGEHTTQHGAEALWQALTARYELAAGEFKEPEPVNNLAFEYAVAD